MTLQQHQRFTLVGFVLVYCSVIFWMGLITAERLASIRGAIELFILLPAGIIGVCLITYARFGYVPDNTAKGDEINA